MLTCQVLTEKKVILRGLKPVIDKINITNY